MSKDKKIDTTELRQSVGVPQPAAVDNTAEVVRDRILGERPVEEAPFLRIMEEAIAEITVDELRKVCETNPKHPDAITFRQSVSKHKDPSQKVYVSKHNLLAVLDNKFVEIFTTIEQGEDGPNTVTRKRLVDKLPQPASDPKLPDRPPQSLVPNSTDLKS